MFHSVQPRMLYLFATTHAAWLEPWTVFRMARGKDGYTLLTSLIFLITAQTHHPRIVVARFKVLWIMNFFAVIFCWREAIHRFVV